MKQLANISDYFNVRDGYVSLSPSGRCVWVRLPVTHGILAVAAAGLRAVARYVAAATALVAPTVVLLAASTAAWAITRDVAHLATAVAILALHSTATAAATTSSTAAASTTILPVAVPRDVSGLAAHVARLARLGAVSGKVAGLVAIVARRTWSATATSSSAAAAPITTSAATASPTTSSAALRALPGEVAGFVALVAD